jgi:hypothetical protein
MNRSRYSVMSSADCRRLLRFALSQVNVASPPGVFAWLEETHPRLHSELLGDIAARLDAAWGRPEFAAVLDDFLYSVSVAIAMFELSGKGDARGASAS